jgi:hypothetical protein
MFALAKQVGRTVLWNWTLPCKLNWESAHVECAAVGAPGVVVPELTIRRENHLFNDFMIILLDLSVLKCCPSCYVSTRLDVHNPWH